MNNLHILRDSCVQTRDYLEGLVEDFDRGACKTGERAYGGSYHDTSLKDRANAVQELVGLDELIKELDRKCRE